MDPDVIERCLGSVVDNGRSRGSGFRVGENLILTANHVVASTAAPEFRPLRGDPVPARVLRSDKKLDVAVLQTNDMHKSPLLWAPAAADDRWEVLTQPSPGDPQISGRIVTTDRLIENAKRNPVSVIQLEASTNVGSFGGYSGSPVVATVNPLHVLGVLVEQGEWRKAPVKAIDGYTNVLYAVPIWAALSALKVEELVPKVSESGWVPQGLANWEMRFAGVLNEAEQLRGARPRAKDHERLEATRRGLARLQDVLTDDSVAARTEAVEDAERDLRVNLGVDPNGTTAGVANTDLLSACHLGLHVIAGLRGDKASSDRHRMRCYLYSPYRSRTQYFTDHFKSDFAPYCADIYKQYEKKLRQVEADAPSVSSRRVGLITGGAALAAGAAAMFFPPTRQVGLVSVGIGARKFGEFSDPDQPRRDLVVAYSLRLDLRCQELARKYINSGSSGISAPPTPVNVTAIPEELINTL